MNSVFRNCIYILCIYKPWFIYELGILNSEFEFCRARPKSVFRNAVIASGQ